ncbi:unnamed protein product, partial [Iphiclides podalirius]
MEVEEDNSGILVETLPLLGVCNLCLSDGVVKSMLIKQEHDGIAETYIEMLLKCFSIDVLTVDLEDTKRLICNRCISKLNDSIQFRQMVAVSLKTLEETVKQQEQKRLALKNVKKELAIEDLLLIDCDDSDNNHVDEEGPLRDVKEEVAVADLMWRDRHVADKPADRIEVAEACDIKQEFRDVEDVADVADELLNGEDLEDYQPKRTRRKTPAGNKKRVTYSVKKKTDTSETERMLQAGLFPFKMYKDRTYSCVICPERSGSLDEIKAHVGVHSVPHLHHAFKKLTGSKLQRFAKASDKLRCKLCKTDLGDYEQLLKHLDCCSRLANRWSGLPFKLEKGQLDCPVCGRSFLNFVNLNTHMNVHYPNHVCDSCGKSFASQARLRGHMRTHELGAFPCRYCGAVFDRVTKRENHVSKEHKAGFRYACKRCNISLSSFYTRQKHLAEVHNEELKRYKCNACTQSYITPGHLSSHVRRDHLNERNHRCDKCDLAFYTRNALKMHMIRHDGERIHSCHVCHKSYQRLKTLREHLRIHNNDKRFVCPVCGRAFTQKCTLKGHLKVHDRRPDGEADCPRSVVICRFEPTKE